MNALSGITHVQRLTAHELLREEPGIGICAEPHGVTAHVFHSASDADVVCAECDSASDCRDRRHRTRTHPVNRKSGNGRGETGKQGCSAPDRQALVALLGGRRDSDVVEAFLRDGGVAINQADHCLDDEVICPGIPVHALFACSAERSSHPVDEYNFSLLGHDASTFLGSLMILGWRKSESNPLTVPTTRIRATARAFGWLPQRHRRLPVMLRQFARPARRVW